MAFTVRGVENRGMGLQGVYGAYTHTLGAAEETLTVTGGAVYLVVINGQVAANTAHQSDAPGYTTSQSGALLTITVKGLVGVSAGTFYVLVGTGA